ncbi:MAG TPA: CHRD domain-containing protein [Deinococcales bacterium]|nr:CHRD domain-containing protein [Deinococcales bacterium]
MPTGAFAGGAPSTARGTATLSDAGSGMTQVSITFTGFAPNSRHAGHFHAGACAPDRNGPVAVPLPEAVADASGNATVSATVQTNRLPLATYINYHQRGATEAGGPGGGVTCGDVP